LVSSIPDHRTPRDPVGIRGVVAPPAIGGHPGCGFVERCEQAVERCHVDVPELASVGTGHSVRCPEWRRTPTVSARPRNLTVLARNEPPLLHVAGLDAVHGTRTQSIVAANDVSFDITRGECLALVGESGSGKTTIARCLLGLHPPSAGDITLDGVALQRMARSRTREQRRRIQIVFQNPRDSLNPRRRILEQVMRPAILLRGLSKEAAREEAGTTLEKVQLSASLRTRLPHELSGGELQRVAIARALAADPDLIVCDEVTSSLDVSVQATVLNLLTELRVEFDLALLFITHDLGVVASIADRVMVLDHGRVCESGRVVDVFRAPRTAYARTLIDAAPSLFGAA
jgi:peptide/nickel transport system ATP-binding protein